MNNKIFLLAFCTLMLAGFSAASTVTSYSEIEYESNHDFFDGELILINVAANQGTDQVDIHLDDSELSNNIEGETSQDVTLEVEGTETFSRYGTRDTGDIPVHRLVPIHEGGFGSESEAENWADTHCFEIDQGDQRLIIDESLFSTNYYVYCAQSIEIIGNVAEFQTPDNIFETEWNLRADGEITQSATLTNGAEDDGVVSDLGPYAKAEWTGNLGTGVESENTDEVMLAHSHNFQDGWRVIDDDAYADYTNYLKFSGGLKEDLQKWRDDGNDYTSNNLESDMVSFTGKAIAEADHPLAESRVADSSFDNGVLEHVKDEPLFNPEFNLYIDAGEDGYVTVTRPTGEPEITDANGAEFDETDSGVVSMEVENVGGAEGSFSGRVQSCSSDFSYDGTETSFNLDSGQSTDIGFRVSFSSQSFEEELIDGTCDLEVTETSTGETDTATVEVQGEQADECVPGTQRPDLGDGNDEIWECDDDGLGWTVVETCDSGQVADPVASGYECVDEEESSGESIPVTGQCERAVLGFGYTDPFCQAVNAVNEPISDFSDGLSSVTTLLSAAAAILVSVVAGVLGFGMGRNVLPDLVSIESQGIRIASGVLLGVMGVALGLAVYTFLSNPFGFGITIILLVLLIAGMMFALASTWKIWLPMLIGRS